MQQIESLIFCEGGSDAAALIGIGCEFVVGRSSALTDIEKCVKIAERVRPKTSIVIADNDPVGLAGANKLAARIGGQVLRLPENTKDARIFVKNGGSLADLMKLLDVTPVG